MPGRKNNATIVDICTKRLNALKSYVDAGALIGVNGEKHTLPEVVAIYEACIASRTALATKRAETKAAMGVREEKEEVRRVADRALKGWVVNEFGEESTEAIDFGFPPARKGTMSVGEKADAVALARATREARHTMGKRQKEGIVGTIAVTSSPDGEGRT